MRTSEEQREYNDFCLHWNSVLKQALNHPDSFLEGILQYQAKDGVQFKKFTDDPKVIIEGDNACMISANHKPVLFRWAFDSESGRFWFSDTGFCLLPNGIVLVIDE
ncbi:hypothetical protein ACPV5G_18125 [Photobacterium damselae]|uniref:hypothetical protein n=1 Tax=Photobacterium damselae TaxID=38293 RepID=UPI0040696AAE